MQCGAKTRSGKPCKSPAMANGRCRMHGGKAAVGPAAGQFKHGRYSKLLPTRLAERYQQAQDDPDLLAMRDEIWLLDARLQDVVSRVDAGESEAVWLQLKACAAQVKQARANSDLDGLRVHLTEMQDLIEQGADDYAAWKEIRSLIDQRARLVGSEQQRMVDLQQMITTERAMVMLGVVVDIIRKHVHDRGTLAAIAAELGGIVAARAGGLPAPRGSH